MTRFGVDDQDPIDRRLAGLGTQATSAGGLPRQDPGDVRRRAERQRRTRAAITAPLVLVLVVAAGALAVRHDDAALVTVGSAPDRTSTVTSVGTGRVPDDAATIPTGTADTTSTTSGEAATTTTPTAVAPTSVPPGPSLPVTPTTTRTVPPTTARPATTAGPTTSAGPSATGCAVDDPRPAGVTCNPLAAEVFRAGTSTDFAYTGPADGILEMYVTGVDGYTVDFRPAFIWAGPPAGACFNGITRAPELCWTGGGDYLSVKDAHNPATDAPGTWWPSMTLHPGAKVLVFVRCNGSTDHCPASMTFHARTVDHDGNLIGTLS